MPRPPAVRRILAASASKGYGPRLRRPLKFDPFVPRLEAIVAERPKARTSRLHRMPCTEGFVGS